MCENMELLHLCSCRPVRLAKNFMQNCSNATVSMTIAIEMMVLLQFCTEMFYIFNDYSLYIKTYIMQLNNIFCTWYFSISFNKNVNMTRTGVTTVLHEAHNLSLTVYHACLKEYKLHIAVRTDIG